MSNPSLAFLSQVTGLTSLHEAFPDYPRKRTLPKPISIFHGLYGTGEYLNLSDSRLYIVCLLVYFLVPDKEAQRLWQYYLLINLW